MATQNRGGPCGGAGTPRWLGTTFVLLLVGCGAAPTPAPVERPDHPVPASVPRGELAFEVDLPAAQDCEEAFDLAVYENRGIELVAWDEGAGSCEGRRITVRFLADRLDRNAVRRLVEENAAAVRSVAPGPSPAEPPSPPAEPAAPSPTNPPAAPEPGQR